MLITSRANPQIQFVKKLRTATFRRETGLHFAEGESLVLDALRSGAGAESVFVAEGYIPPEFPADINIMEVTPPVMEALCEGKSAPRLCAVLRTPDLRCPAHYPGGLLVVLECLQDPGNVGTLIRTADALGACGVLLSPDCADPFAGKTLRAAMGSSYHIPVWQGELPAELPRLLAQGFSLLCGHLHGHETLPPPTENTALVIGNEGHGVSGEIAALCYPYRLPMRGRAQSLNAAVFGAVLMDRVVNR
ncbi:MAG: RNA methyltransferase [Clostridiales bacterium]|nr:RNA methyltransferase [Clostridiales bacterium]